MSVVTVSDVFKEAARWSEVIEPGFDFNDESGAELCKAQIARVVSKYLSPGLGMQDQQYELSLFGLRSMGEKLLDLYEDQKARLTAAGKFQAQDVLGFLDDQFSEVLHRYDNLQKAGRSQTNRRQDFLDIYINPVSERIWADLSEAGTDPVHQSPALHYA